MEKPIRGYVQLKVHQMMIFSLQQYQINVLCSHFSWDLLYHLILHCCGIN